MKTKTFLTMCLLFSIIGCEGILEPEGTVNRSVHKLDRQGMLLNINSEPSGALIYINSRETGQKTPAIIKGWLRLGTNEIKLEQQGYFTWQGKVQMEVAQTKTVDVEMDAIPDVRIAFTEVDSVYWFNLNEVDGGKVRTKCLSWVYYYGYNNLIKWSPNGQYLAYAWDLGIVVYDFITGNGKGLIKRDVVGSRFYDFSWSNGSRFVVFGEYTRGIYRVDVMDTEVYEKIYDTRGFTYDHNPVYSPNEMYLAIIHHEWQYSYWLRVISFNPLVGNIPQFKFPHLSWYDRHADLSWINSSQLLSKNTRSNRIYLSDIETRTHTVVNYLSGLAVLRLAPNKSSYLVTTTGTLRVAEVGDWSLRELASYSRIASVDWLPGSEGIVVLAGDGIHVVFLNGQDYHILFKDYTGKGGITVGIK